jgi:hypothetical protein
MAAHPSCHRMHCDVSVRGMFSRLSAQLNLRTLAGTRLREHGLSLFQCGVESGALGQNDIGEFLMGCECYAPVVDRLPRLAGLFAASRP